MTRKLIKNSLFVLFLFLQATSVWGLKQLTLNDFTQSDPVEASFISVGGEAYAKMGWHPDFTWSGFELGLDLNIYVPFNSGAPYPKDLEALVLRHVAYTYKDRLGLEWGHLRNVGLGQGLLMADYDSGAGRSGIFNTSKAGFLGFARVGDYHVDAIYTASKVQGGRLNGPIPKLSLMGVPFYAGATYIQDSNGTDYVENDQAIQRAPQEGYEVDVYWPIGGMFLTVYGAYSELMDNLDPAGLDGNGGSLGVRGDMLGWIYYKAAYVRLGEGFVPNYFNSIYEVTSTPTPLDKSVNGYTAGVGSNFGGNRFKLGAEYERFGERNLVNAHAGIANIGPLSAVMNYTVPFQGSQNRIIQGEVQFRGRNGLIYNINMRRVYTTNNDYIETYSVSATVDVKKFF